MSNGSSEVCLCWMDSCLLAQEELEFMETLGHTCRTSTEDRPFVQFAFTSTRASIAMEHVACEPCLGRVLDIAAHAFLLSVRYMSGGEIDVFELDALLVKVREAQRSKTCCLGIV